MNRAWAIGCVVLVLGVSPGGPLGAVDLSVPTGAVATFDATAPGLYRLPTGIAQDGFVPMKDVGGLVTTRSWRIASPGVSSDQIIDPLIQQVAEHGMQTLVSCADVVCGGFDFRFALDVVPPPDMFVDLAGFRVHAASGADGVDHVLIVTSQTPDAGFLQITTITQDSVAPKVEDDAPALTVAPVAGAAPTLDADGRAVLEDLQFAPGSAALTGGPFDSLSRVAAYMAQFPDRELALVGHTDSSGGLDGNIRLSRARAQAVRDALIAQYGVAKTRIRAEGMGYLAPRASNLTPEGRARNRRVEVIVTSTQ